MEEKTEFILNTDKTKVLLKASKDNKEISLGENEKISDVKDAKLEVYEDKDDDGSFETKTQTATPTKIPDEEKANNESNNNSIINTGDSIGVYIAILVISIVLTAIITYFRHKK